MARFLGSRLLARLLPLCCCSLMDRVLVLSVLLSATLLVMKMGDASDSNKSDRSSILLAVRPKSQPLQTGKTTTITNGRADEPFVFYLLCASYPFIECCRLPSSCLDRLGPAWLFEQTPSCWMIQPACQAISLLAQLGER